MKSVIDHLIFPKSLLEYFEVKEVITLCSIATKQEIYEIKLEEKNRLPEGYNKDEYESKGFLSEKTIQDFPLRGKAVYLLIKRRRWRIKTRDKEDITSDYSFIAEGSKLTKELSDFLKGTGRDQRGYN